MSANGDYEHATALDAYAALDKHAAMQGGDNDRSTEN